jgi:hypothetical protein
MAAVVAVEHGQVAQQVELVAPVVVVLVVMRAHTIQVIQVQLTQAAAVVETPAVEPVD